MGQLSYNDLPIKSALFAPSSSYAILIFDGERLLLLGRAPRFFRLHWPTVAEALAPIPVWPTVRGQVVVVRQIPHFPCLQVWFGPRECSLRVDSRQLEPGQQTLAGPLLDDPPAEELGQG